MNSEWLLAFFLIGVVVAALDVIRRAFMDMQRMESELQIKKAMRRLRKPMQPWVTVLVYGEDGTALERTLRQVRKNRYERFDVVKVGKHTAAAYRTAYRKSKCGEIILCVQAGDVIDTYCIKRAVVLQPPRPRLRTQKAKRFWSVPVRQSVIAQDGIRGIAQRLRSIVWTPPAKTIKAYTRQGIREQAHVQGVAKSTLISVVGSMLVMIAVVSGVLLQPVAFLYFWVLFSVYLIALILLSGPLFLHQKIPHEKIRLLFAVPSALLFVPAAGFIGGTLQLFTRK